MAQSSTQAHVIRRKSQGTSASKNMKLFAHSLRFWLRRKRLVGTRYKLLIIMEQLILPSRWIK
jgi:hypothetical protein